MVGRLVIKDNKMNNENTLSTKSAQSAKKRKGGIREHNCMPVKSHEAHTFYKYESHIGHGTAHGMATQKRSHCTLTPVRYMSKAIKIKVTFKVTST